MHPDLFDAYYKELEGRIRNQARRIARGDEDFADDLIQETLWKLSEFDTGRILDNPRGYLWRSLCDHMLSVYRRERRARVIGPRRSKGVEHRRRRNQPRHLASRRLRTHVDVGPRHDNVAPTDDEGYEELWEGVIE